MNQQLRPGIRFLGIPAIFLHHHKDKLKEWLSNLPKYGPTAKFWAEKSPAGHAGIGDGGSAPMVPSIEIVELRITILGGKFGIVRPADDKSERILKRHCKQLEELYDVPDMSFYEGLRQ